MSSEIAASIGRSRMLTGLFQNLSRTGRDRKQVVSAAADAAVTVAALWLAYTLRHGLPFSDFRATWHLFTLMPAMTVLVFSALGIYRWVVRSSNQRLYYRVVKGCVLVAFGLVLLVFLLPPDRVTPRSLFAIFGLLLLVGTTSTRLLWQSRFDTDAHGMPVALYGAGVNGRRTARMMASSEDYRPVVFIDDDASLTGSTVEGLPVIHGDDESLRQRLDARDVVEVVISIAALPPARLEALLEQFRDFSLPVRTVPSVTELVSGQARPEQIRDVSIADILGRPEVEPDAELMGKRVTGRSVLVTGGGGSIGSELARQIANLAPSRLVVLDSSEVALYRITEELAAAVAHAGAGTAFVPVLGSVRDRSLLDRVLAEHDTDTLFHAAAYKHVPIVERQPSQGVRTNVFGTRTAMQAAIDAGVRDFVLISTDKAVRPTNAMGATKRVAELLLQAATRAQSGTRLSMVRFGNVLGSSGSVVPKFKDQILSGGPVTLTDERMTRYFMTIPEAAQLVLQASAIADGGEVFVLDMGSPVRISDLARSMVALYGRRLKSESGREGDIDIVVQGIRPGEKLYEELFLTNDHRATGVAKILTADEAWLPQSELERGLERLREAAERYDAVSLRTALFGLVKAAGADAPAPEAPPEPRVMAASPEAKSARDDAAKGDVVKGGTAKGGTAKEPALAAHAV